jgi:hypothetical protein
MAVYKIFPSKDASIYTEYPSMNTGLDSIIEASTYISQGSAQVSRYLIQFTDNEINNLLNSKISGSNFKTYLKNYAAVVNGLNLESTLYFYPVSGSWGMGTGHYKDIPNVTNGVSWTYRSYEGTNPWPTSSFGAYATASYSGSNYGGGTWYTGSALGLNIIQSQSFSYSDPIDINVDVTNTILTWYSGSLPNNGFIVKQSNDNEFINDEARQATFKYFSIDTNTIYPPYLEFKWNDYSFNTGSSTQTILTTSQAFISVYNNAGTYYPESIAKLRIAATPKYPARVYQTSSLYTTNYYLPSNTSLYAIKDSETNEYVVDFDANFTKISADATSSYFNIYMNGLEPERYYTILIQTIIDGNTIVFDENIMFKVING